MRLGIIAIGRPTFDVPFAQSVADQAAANLERDGHEIVGSANLVMDNESARSSLHDLSSEKLDALVVFQATFADSTLIVQISETNLPLILWAFPEPRTGGRLRLNSLCGINLAGYTLTNLDRAYGWIYKAPDDPEAGIAIAAKLRSPIERRPSAQVEPFDQFDQLNRRAATLVRDRLAMTTVGRVGDRPPGFEPCDYQPAQLRKAVGVAVDETDLADLFTRAAMAPAEDVRGARADIPLVGLGSLDQTEVDRSLRLNVGLQSLVSDRHWAGVATRCWPETFTDFGGAACSPMAMLNGHGVPGTCEADVYGTVTALILQWLADKPAFVADLVDLDRDTDTGVFWHCGLAPAEMADPLFPMTATDHPNRHMALLNEFPLKPGIVTILRLSQSGNQHRLVVGRGEMVRARRSFSGTSGVVRFGSGVDEVLDTVLSEGLEHHYGIVYGDVVDALRALASLLELPIVDL